MDQAHGHIRDDLVQRRDKFGEHIDNGGELSEVYNKVQAKYSHLDTFEQLATRNAGRVFEEMEGK